MPRRELLTSSERLELLAFSTDEGELIRLYTLTTADLAFARQHCGDHNRIGIAVLMSYLRYPERVHRCSCPRRSIARCRAKRKRLVMAVCTGVR